jgi:two-component system, OmpR family, aerobic respiration control protein ArcA
MNKKINIQSLVDQIEKITKEKIANESVVSLDEYRKLKNKKKEQLNVLVVEDDETMRKALVKLLESDGYHVISAADGI